MPIPDNWDEFRKLFARLALARGYDVPQRFGGRAEELYCFPQISKTISDMGETEFIEIMKVVWADDIDGQRRIVALAEDYFSRKRAGETLTRKEAKDEWKAVTNRDTDKENAEAAVVWGLAEMLQVD